MSSSISRENPLVAMTILFVGLSLLVGTVGSFAVRRETQSIRTDRHNELHAIASLKISQILAWRNERLSDATSGASHLGLRDIFKQWLRNPDDASARKRVIQDLTLLRDAYGYSHIAILAADGRLRLSLAPRVQSSHEGTDVLALAKRSLEARQPVMGDLVRDPQTDRIHLDVIAPIPEAQRNPSTLLLLRSDPETRLFPSIQSWPLPSASAEILLIRKEGDHVRFLTRLRHDSALPLTRTLPLSQWNPSRGQAVQDLPDVSMGLDYRGIEVLADHQPVPDTSWFLVAKVDAREAMAEARYRNAVIQGFALLVILSGALLLGFLYYARQSKHYQDLFQAMRFVENQASTSEPSRDWRREAEGLGLLAAIIGLVVLAGWTLSQSAMLITFPGFATTKANTALGMALAGISLSGLTWSRKLRALSQLAAVLVFLLGALTLVEHGTGLELGIDQLLFQAPAGMYGALAPGRMAPITALSFALCGSALLMAGFRSTQSASQWLGLSVGLIALFVLLGHLMGPFEDQGIGRYLQMTFSAGLVFGLISAGLLLRNVQKGFMRRVAADSIEGWLLRRLVPFYFGIVLLVTVIETRLVVLGWLKPAPAAALASMVFVVLLLAAAEWVAHSLDRLDAFRRRAERDLRESQTKLQLLLDSTGEAIYGFDMKGDCTFCNQTLLRMMGFQSVDEVLGRNMHDLIHHSHYDKTPFAVETCRIFQAFRMGESAHVDDEVLWRADGTCFWAEYWSFPQFRDGQVVGAVVTFIDITERRLAQRFLQENRETLNRVLDTIPQAVSWKDLESRYLGCNQFFAIQAGLKDPMQVLGLTDFDLPWAHEEAEAFRADDREVMEQNQAKLHITKPLRNADGAKLWVDTSKVPLRNADGSVFGVLGIFEDTTERQRMEEALRTSEAWHRAILGTAMDGFMVLAPDGKILQVNEAYARMSGYSREELLQMRAADLDVIDNQEEVVAQLRSVRERGHHRFETRNRCANGRVLDMEVSLQVAPGDGDNFMAFLRDITARKEAEAAILASQSRLEEAQTLAHLGNWELDLKTSALFWSKEIYRIFEIDPEQFGASYEAFLEVIHPEDRERVNRVFTDSVSSHTSYGIIHRLLLPDGTLKFVEERGQTLYDADGTPLRSLGTIQDITDLKNAEASRMEIEERLQVLSDNLPGGMVYQVDFGEDGRNRQFTYLSAGVQSLHGFSAEQIMRDPMNLYGQIHPDDQAVLAEKEALATSTMSSFSAEYRICRPSGEIRWYLAISSPRRLANNHLVWDGVELDITNRKLVENELLGRTELLNLTGHMAQVGGMTFEPRTLKGTWTEEMARIYDLEYTGEIDAEAALGLCTEASRQRFMQAVRDADELGKPFDLELEMTTAQGIRKDLRVQGSPVLEEGGKVIRSIVQDITVKKATESELRHLLEVAERSRRSLLSLLEDQRESESEIRRLNADLERRVADRTLELASANKELEAFAYSVSHDLRAPLRHMDGFLGMLARHLGDGLDAKATHYLEVAQGASVRMGQLVDALLSFSRLGRAELHIVDVELGPIVASVIDEFKAECEGRQVEWRVGQLPRLHVDPTLLRLVFQNLVGNALKFTRNRPDTLIEIQPIEGLEGERGILIRDNGAGFDPAYSHKLFGVFQRLHRETEFEGTGIGLANVHRIVTRHRGRIWAEGKPGEGATFFLAFPIEENLP